MKKIEKIAIENIKRIQDTSYEFEEPNGQIRIYRPFYSSLVIKQNDFVRIEIEDGGTIDATNYTKNNQGRLEIRIGDGKKGGSVEYINFFLPEIVDRFSFDMQIWRAANNCFWDAVDNYETALSKTLGRIEDREMFKFHSKEPIVKHNDTTRYPKLNISEIKDAMCEISAKISSIKEIYKNEIEFTHTIEDIYFANSEGSLIHMRRPYYKYLISTYAIDRQNKIIPTISTFRGRAHIPSHDMILKTSISDAHELLLNINAPQLTNGIYPAILDAENTGVLAHEMIGHASEAHRMINSKELSAVFYKKIDDKVAPDFITIINDSTDPNLSGSYLYDEDGVKAQKVTIIKDGILKSYLHSRETAGFFKTQSNGCSRSENTQTPCTRMSNIKLYSTNKVSGQELKDRLIEEIKRQKLKFGLFIKGSIGGATIPEDSVFETYPQTIFKVYPDGKEERVRNNVYIVGTPYTVIDNILVTNDKHELCDRVCGAESGTIPATLTAPSSLLKSIEINKLGSHAYEDIKNMIYKKPEL